MTSVCREISLNLTTRTWQGTVPVVPVRPTFEQMFDSRSYVASCTGGKRIEAMAPGRAAHDGQDGLSLHDKVVPGSLLFQAAGECFMAHLPFALRPEVLMHLIVHECAETVKQNPDEYRHLFTRSSARETICVVHDGLVPGNPQSPWIQVMPMFERELRERCPDGIMARMLPDFSTHTSVSRAASMVAFMDAASPFYDYHVQTLCGIPLIRLMGCAADWRKLCVAAGGLGEVFSRHLSGYFARILPVLATIADQADGAPLDERFWSSMYKYESGSGGDTFNGWLAAFIEYVSGPDGLEPIGPQRTGYDWQTACAENQRFLLGLSPSSVPSQVCSVPFSWDITGGSLKMLFLGGVLEVPVVDGFVTPMLSFAVVHAE